MLQTEREVGFEIAELLAAIVAARRCPQPMKGLAVADQFVETVGQLDLAAGAGSGVAEMAEDLRLDDIADDDHPRRARSGDRPCPARGASFQARRRYRNGLRWRSSRGRSRNSIPQCRRPLLPRTRTGSAAYRQPAASLWAWPL